MSEIYLLLLATVTSGAAWIVGTRVLSLPASVGIGVGRMLETLGLAVVFFAANVALTIAGTLALRAMGTFVSLYIATDQTVVILSTLQAIAFQFWRYGSRG